MNNSKISRFTLAAAVALSALGLSACSTVGYRCPLENGKKVDSPTACAGMQDAMAGAKKGTGGKTSVLMDDKGRLVPRELLQNKVAKPLSMRSDDEPYRDASGNPVFYQPKKFMAWTGAFTDANGNLHDGGTAWFVTPGRWAYGSVDRPTDVGNNLMRPALPDARPAGRVVKIDQRTGEVMQAQPQATAQQTSHERDKAALQNLSQAANSAAANAKGQGAAPAQAPSTVVTSKPATSPGVTAPMVGLND